MESLHLMVRGLAVLILLSAVAASAEGDVEVTLTDGTTLTGQYDASTGKMQMLKPFKAEITLTKDRIAAIRPAGATPTVVKKPEPGAPADVGDEESLDSGLTQDAVVRAYLTNLERTMRARAQVIEEAIKAGEKRIEDLQKEKERLYTGGTAKDVQAKVKSKDDLIEKERDRNEAYRMERPLVMERQEWARRNRELFEKPFLAPEWLDADRVQWQGYEQFVDIVQMASAYKAKISDLDRLRDVALRQITQNRLVFEYDSKLFMKADFGLVVVDRSGNTSSNRVSLADRYNDLMSIMNKIRRSLLKKPANIDVRILRILYGMHTATYQRSFMAYRSSFSHSQSGYSGSSLSSGSSSRSYYLSSSFSTDRNFFQDIYSDRNGHSLIFGLELANTSGDGLSYP